MINEIAVKTSAVGAVGAAIAPNYAFGEYLMTHGIGVLSYSEWIRVIGCLYVLILICKMAGAGSLVKLVVGKIRSKMTRK